jgi:probable O-glycosylation ligase (exosortase A-associated)
LLVAGVLPSVTFLAERGRLSRFMRIWVGIQALTALVAIRSLGAGPGGFLLDENDLALSLAMGLPYAYFLSRSPLAGRLQRICCLTAAVMMAVGVIATNSRGGFLGLVGSALGILAYSKNRLRIAVLLCAVALAALPLMPSAYLDRLATMNDPTDSTRVDRVYSWRRAWEMFENNPFLGVGAGNYPWRVAEYELKSPEYNPSEGRLHGGRAAHSLYLTLLAELGLTGATVYGLMLLRTWRTIQSVIRGAHGATDQSAETIELALFARAMGASLIAFLTAGAFISVLYYPHYWYLIGFVVSVDRAIRKRKPGA